MILLVLTQMILAEGDMALLTQDFIEKIHIISMMVEHFFLY